MKTKPFPMSALVLSIPWKPCFAGFVSVTSDETSVFSLWNDAELSVKCSAAEIIKNLPPQDFISLNDLISVVEALQKYWPESPFVLQVRFTFHQLYETSINGGVCWVPAQVSFSRIESADKMAKAAVTMTRSSIPVFVTIRKSQVMWNNDPDGLKYYFSCWI